MTEYILVLKKIPKNSVVRAIKWFEREYLKGCKDLPTTVYTEEDLKNSLYVRTNSEYGSPWCRIFNRGESLRNYAPFTNRGVTAIGYKEVFYDADIETLGELV